MGRTKSVEVYITSLKITAEDAWLKEFISIWGDSIETSPQYKYLLGFPQPLEAWMKFRGLPVDYIAAPLMGTLRSLNLHGQEYPIKIYEDMRINTGHKRAAALLFLGKKSINAVFVKDDYKL